MEVQSGTRQPRLRILAFNHFFDQDLDALHAALAPDETMSAIPYQRVQSVARRYFPEDAFDGVERAYDADLSECWRNYAPAVDELALWLTAAYRPSVFVTPSDSFFYLRPLIERLGLYGVPTVVAQKETTISPMVMDEHSLRIGRAVPFMCAAMTVCSERHRQFWIRTGADGRRIFVTGQPRFDIYAGAGPARHDGPPRLLFLSYADEAYLPSDAGQDFDGSWAEMRQATESIVAEVADAATWVVTVKPHPQQRHQPDWLGQAVTRADRYDDTRRLILQSDVVVGFQTTALFEAAAAGRPVVYAAWGELFERMKADLIPFHTHPDLATYATSPSELRRLLAEPELLRAPAAEAEQAIDEHLGPVDGRASERVLNVIRDHSRPAPAQIDRLPKRRIGAALAHACASIPAAIAARAAQAGGRAELAGRLRRRGLLWRQEGREASAILTRGHRSG